MGGPTPGANTPHTKGVAKQATVRNVTVNTLDVICDAKAVVLDSSN